MSSQTTGHSHEPNAITEAEHQLRSSTHTALLAAAKKAHVHIHADHFAYASGKEGIVANTAIVDFEKLTLEELNKGANLMFMYLSPSNEALQQSVPPGFYLVRSKGIQAELLNASGEVVTELPLQVEITPINEANTTREISAPARKGPIIQPFISVSGGIGDGCISGDIGFTLWGRNIHLAVTICV